MLTIVGTGIRIGQLTIEAQAVIKAADVVYAIVPNQVMMGVLLGLNSNTQSLSGYYQYGKERRTTYAEMVDTTIDAVRSGKSVCMVFYGHPNLFVRPSRDAANMARREGFRVVVLPGISAEDCLFADIEIDPSETGWQSYEATQFIESMPAINPRAFLILWQTGLIGDLQCLPAYPMAGFEKLKDLLGATYSSEHEFLIYEASEYPFVAPKTELATLRELKRTDFSDKSTLVAFPAKT